MGSVTSVYFCAVAQSRISSQMDVFRWLLNDSSYRVCAIEHNRDISDSSHEILLDADGNTAEIKEGDLIPAHWHILIKSSARLADNTMTKRFGGYLHFQICSDPHEYARYLTHDTFRSKDKFQYEQSAVVGDTAFYNELLRRAVTVDQVQIYHRLRIYLDRCGDNKSAIRYALAHDDIEVVKFAASHAYFVNNLM